MKKYLKLTGEEFVKWFKNYDKPIKGRGSWINHWSPDIGYRFYRHGVEVKKGVSILYHFSDEVCSTLRLGKDRVKCLCKGVNGKGKEFYLHGTHLVGMCPFKNKWRPKQLVKKFYEGKIRI